MCHCWKLQQKYCLARVPFKWDFFMYALMAGKVSTRNDDVCFLGLLWPGDQFYGDKYGNHSWSGFWDCILTGKYINTPLPPVLFPSFSLPGLQGRKDYGKGLNSACSLVLRSSVHWFSFFQPKWSFSLGISVTVELMTSSRKTTCPSIGSNRG